MMRFLLDLLFPPKCICCSEILDYDRKDSPMCSHCSTKWETAKESCRIESFGQPVMEYDFGDSKESGSVLYLVHYTPGEKGSVESRLILNLKDRANGRCVRFVASELAAVITEQILSGLDHTDAVITWIPRRRQAVIDKGFDHMERVAEALSKLIGIPHADILKRRIFSEEQKTLSHKSRRENAGRSMYIKPDTDLSGKTVLLIDDIVTSGASIDTATCLLTEAGAMLVSAVTVSATRQPRDGQRSVEDVFNIIKNRPRLFGVRERRGHGGNERD